MRKFILLLFCFPVLLSAQYLRIGQGYYAGTAAGPVSVNLGSANFTSRYAYIFPKAVLGDLKHGDTMLAMELGRLAGSKVNSNCNLTIFLKNTTRNDFGAGKLYWPGEVSNATRVYDQNPAGEISNLDGFFKIPFYNSSFRFDTTKGENLVLLVEYKQTAVQPGIIYWYYEDATTVSGYGTNQTKYFAGTTANDSLNNSTDRHPTVGFYFPRYNNDIMMVKVYTLGKIPVPLGNPDSVQALVRNVGKKAQTSIKAVTWMKGTNKNQLDSTTFSLGAGQEKYVYIPSLNPAKKGMDTVFVSIKGDENKANDTGFSFRLANENIYSYRDVTIPPDPGGIGFNGSTGDFVARFFSNKAKNINQVTVNFAITGRPFKVGIWQSKSNNRPGKLLYLSDSLNTVAGNYILDLKKPVSVSGSFFVGVRQLGTNNVAFGYQTEDPVRPNTFYYAAPMGDTGWADFYPDAPFKFLIEPRTQGDTDLTALSADYPKDSIDMYKADTMAPKGTIANIGVKDMLDSFDVVCEIRVFGKTVYKEVLRDTLHAGRTRSYTFPKKFWPVNFGEHSLLIYTRHPKDQIRDNDTAIRKFYVGVKNDVIFSSVYDPPNNTLYNYFVDTFMPLANIQNISYNNTPSFAARCIIKKGNTVLYNKVQNLQLPKFQSKIVNWPTYKCMDTGKLQVFFITEMTGDANRKNDTVLRTVYVIKLYDVAVDTITTPDRKIYYNPGTSVKPSAKVANYGVLNLYNIKVWYRVTSAATTTIWTDTLLVDFPPKYGFPVTFNKAFKPVKKGLYTIVVGTSYTDDYYKPNDSLKYNFYVGYPYDYNGISILAPANGDTLNVGAAPTIPKARIRNNGFIKNTDVVPVICQIFYNNKNVYFDAKNVSLDTSQTSDITFTNSFNPVNAGDYQMWMYTNYTNDVYRKNDTVKINFKVQIGKDATVLSVDTPLLSDAYKARISNVKIAATIGNKGKLKMNAVRLYAEIYHGTKLEYYQYRDDSLLGYESKKLWFGQTFLPPDSGTYRLLLRTFSMDDQNIYNDSAESYFFVTKGADAAVTKWLEPVDLSSVMNTASPLTPTVIVKNVGMDTTSLAGKVFYSIRTQAAGTILYRDSVPFNDLRMGVSDTLKAGSGFPMPTPGIYIARAIVAAGGDQYKQNDTLEAVFSVLLNKTNTLSKNNILVYPNPSKDMLWVQSNLPVQSITIRDISGKQLWHAENCTSAEMKYLPAGTYLADVETRNGTTRFLIVHQD